MTRRATIISRRRLAVTLAIWLTSAASAFRCLDTSANGARRRQWQRLTGKTDLCHRPRPDPWDDEALTVRIERAGAGADEEVTEEGRRSFMTRASTAAAVLLLPPLSCAKDDPAPPEESQPPIVKAASLINDESELDKEVVREEADEKRSIKDERQLISEIKRDIALEKRGSSTPSQIERAQGVVRGDTELLIREEEQLKSEAEGMIKRIEAIESEVQGLEDGDDFGLERMARARRATTEKTLEVFKDKLRARATQKEDLIARLKRQSEAHIDPKTGKYRIMTHQEYIDRVEATDVDFVRFLKDTVASEQEWRRELAAFEGFLNRALGPTVRELSADLGPPAETRRRHDARRSRLRFEAYVRESSGHTDSLVEKLSYLF